MTCVALMNRQFKFQHATRFTDIPTTVVLCMVYFMDLEARRFRVLVFPNESIPPLTTHRSGKKRKVLLPLSPCEGPPLERNHAALLHGNRRRRRGRRPPRRLLRLVSRFCLQPIKHPLCWQFLRAAATGTSNVGGLARTCPTGEGGRRGGRLEGGLVRTCPTGRGGRRGGRLERSRRPLSRREN